LLKLIIQNPDYSLEMQKFKITQNLGRALKRRNFFCKIYRFRANE